MDINRDFSPDQKKIYCELSRPHNSTAFNKRIPVSLESKLCLKLVKETKACFWL